MIGHVRAADEADAERLARERYPLALKVTVKPAPTAADLERVARLACKA